MSAVILSFPDGARLEESAAGNDEDDVSSCATAHVSMTSKEHKENILDRIDQLRHLADAGRVGGLILIASDPVTGHFLTDWCQAEDMDRSDLFGFIGVLQTLKTEITEEAMMAPVMTLAGAILNPYCIEEEE